MSFVMNRRWSRVVIGVAVALFLITTTHADVRQTPGEVKIAVYNVENFFDVFDDPYTRDESTSPKFRFQIETLARAIRKMNADVLGIVEVENAHVLKAMNQEMLQGMGYDYIDVGPSNDGRGIKLGIMSRLPIHSVTSYRHHTWNVEGYPTPMRMSRDLYEVVLDTGMDKRLTVMVVHFKSKRDSIGDPQSQRRRNAEARFTRRIVDEKLNKYPDKWLALIGDYNDTPGSPVLDILLKGGDLIDVHADLPPDQRITYLKEPYRSTIDYICVSRALARHLKPGSVGVVSDPEELKGADHAPLYATFNLNK